MSLKYIPEIKVNTYFMSEQIAKVRWLPQRIDQYQWHRFLTASGNMPQNYVRLFNMKENNTPFCCDKVQFDGDICGLEFVGDEVAAGCSSDGRLSLLSVKQGLDDDHLDLIGRTECLHNFNELAAPCTGLAVYGREIATIGADGRINILYTNDLNQVKRTIKASSVSLHAVTFVNQHEVLVGNRMGVISLFDIRVGNEEGNATQSFMTSSEDDRRSTYVSCLTSHPMQNHIVMAGSEEGSITIWDLRQLGYPSNYLSAHSSAITDIGFHRQDPSKLFTTAEMGELWQWTQNTSINDINEQRGDNNNIWLHSERAKRGLNVTALISKLNKPINCFDVQSNKIICGGETEAVYIIDNI